jgi:RNA 3'-terminal phosphate cyclase (ATP)
VAVLVIDGRHGEGGGQIVRTALCLAAVCGRAVRIEGIRAGRERPGLAPQHLTVARALAALCGAKLAGAELGSESLEFEPASAPRAGRYEFDVADASEGGSAGSVTLVLQAILLPLVLAIGDSQVVLRGGTHVAWSPPLDYAHDVWLDALRRLGLNVRIETVAYGFYPAGGGEIRVFIRGIGDGKRHRLAPLAMRERGSLHRVFGRALSANLPATVGRRLADRSRELIEAAGLRAHVSVEQANALCPGGGLFLTAESANARAGFGALVEHGVAAEEVAQRAVADLLAYHKSGAALDAHLGDQLLALCSQATGPSTMSIERVSKHLITNAWVVEQFGIARILIARDRGGTAMLTVTPR